MGNSLVKTTHKKLSLIERENASQYIGLFIQLRSGKRFALTCGTHVTVDLAAAESNELWKSVSI